MTKSIVRYKVVRRDNQWFGVLDTHRDRIMVLARDQMLAQEQADKLNEWDPSKEIAS